MSEFIGEFVTLMIMAFALSMDAFSIGLGMGMYTIRLRQILKIGITIGIFHVVMPMIGMVTGQYLSHNLGEVAILIGGGMLLLLGLHMLWSGFHHTEKSVFAPVGAGLLVFAFSVSLDSFSVGLTLGIYGAHMVLVLTSFGFSACILTWSGLLLGRKVQGLFGSYSEALGGSILLLFGMKLLLL